MVEQVRRFNRTVTERVGALEEAYQMGAHTPATATDCAGTKKAETTLIVNRMAYIPYTL